MNDSPVILGLVSDLFFTVKIEDVARRLGFRVQWIERASQVAPDDRAEDGVPERQFAEPLRGQIAVFFHEVVRLQPALIIVDLNNRELPWPKWMAALKSSPATRRIPVLAFGSHMDLETQNTARAAGADEVLAKSRFSQALPELIRRHARVSDANELRKACRGELSELALNGLELFNAGRYFEAHEELELAWKEEAGPARELYRAILQVAVAYMQITRRNYNGAVKMFMRLRQWIGPLPDECRGVDVARLRAEANLARDTLEALGPDRIGEFDLSLLTPVVYKRQ